MLSKIIQSPNVRSGFNALRAPVTLNNSSHVGTVQFTTKDQWLNIYGFTAKQADLISWVKNRRLLVETFMLGLNMSNVDNMINFRCLWNGVTVVSDIYARPNLSGAPPFAAGQNRCFDVVNKTRIEGINSETATTAIVRPRTHTRYESNFGGTTNYGGQEEYLYGQQAVNIVSDVAVSWQIYLQGTGAITVFFDHYNMEMK